RRVLFRSSYGGIDGFGRPRCDRHFVLGMIKTAIAVLRFCRDLFSKYRNPCHWRILVISLFHISMDQSAELRGTVKAGEALGKVDGVVIVAQLGHHGEDRRCDSGKL